MLLLASRGFAGAYSATSTCWLWGRNPVAKIPRLLQSPHLTPGPHGMPTGPPSTHCEASGQYPASAGHVSGDDAHRIHISKVVHPNMISGRLRQRLGAGPGQL